jgi:tetratricopeptide (TPR) repeat protein
VSTSDDDWQAALALLEALLELPPDQREAAFATSGASPAVLARVRRMLAAENAGSVLDAPLAAAFRAPRHAEGARLGRWMLLEVIGRGGMSTVWRARSTVAPVGQEAALKVMEAGAIDDAALRRFARELEVLSRLSHPSVAALIEAGRADDGVPWFAMGLVDGQPIDTWCETKRADRETRLGLLIQACAAVSHAHRHLVVHRDIKPGNVLVDGGGRVVLVDFGISRLLEETREHSTGTYAFTPRFAAPEQRSGGAISTATDLWGLGALAHWLLAGEPPTLRDDADAVMPPTTLPADLRAILSHCLQRDPAERYRSADALADDLQAFLDGRPVAARRGGWAYRAGRWLRRHPGVTALAGALALSVAVGVTATVLQSRRAEAEAERAVAAQRVAEEARTTAERAQRSTQAALERATSLRDYLVRVFDGSNPNSGPQADAAALLARGETLVQERLDAGEALLAADLLLVLGQARQLRGEYGPADALFERGLAVAGTSGGSVATRAHLHFGRGEVARTQGRHADARAHYASAERLALDGGLPDERTLEYALARLTAESAAGGSAQPLDGMRDWLTRIDAAPDAPPALRLRGLDVYSTMLALAGTPDTGPLQERRLALAAEVYAEKPGWLAFAYADAVPSFRRWRAWDRAAHYAAASLRIVDAHYDAPHVIPAIATCNAAGLALDRGRPDEAMALLDRTLAIDRALARKHVHALSCLVHRAEAARALGDSRVAFEALDAAEVMLAALALADDRTWRQTLCAQRVEALRVSGDEDRAWAALARCGDATASPKLRLLAAERALGAGDLAAAASALDGLPAWSEPPPRDAPAGLEAWALTLAVAEARGDSDAPARRQALREAVEAMPAPWAAQSRWRECVAAPPGTALCCLPGR